MSSTSAAVDRGVRPVIHEWIERLKSHELALLPALALAVIIGSAVSPAFLTSGNLVNVLQQSSELAVLVAAESLILIVGRFDLSLESIVGLAPMVAAYLMADESIGGSGLGVSPVIGMAVCLVIGVLVGAFNGLLIVKLKLNAFIVTLAVLILLRGVTLGLTNGQTLFNLPPAFTFLGGADWFGVPVSVWLAGAIYVVLGAFMRYHRTGRAIYAIGGNADAARAAGIRVERIVWGTLIFGGLLAALAGLMLAGRLSSTTAASGQNMIFTVFAAAVIGGISLDGGRGRLLGALTGVLLLSTIQNILTLSSIQTFWIDASFGAIILVSLIVTRLTGASARAG